MRYGIEMFDNLFYKIYIKVCKLFTNKGFESNISSKTLFYVKYSYSEEERDRM